MLSPQRFSSPLVSRPPWFPCVPASPTRPRRSSSLRWWWPWVVTELAARNRHHYQWAHAESDYVGLIHSLSELSASGAPREAVIQRARTELIELLHLRACRYESESSGRRTIRIEHDGHVLLGGNVWNVDRMGLPGPELELLVQGRGRTQGRFALTPTPGFPVSLERRVVAVAIADQVGAAHRLQLRSA